MLPVHPNPNVTAAVWRHLDGILNITLTPPLHYREIIALAEGCHFAMIDSGGLQEELPCLGKPALVLRNVSDRPAATEAGRRRLLAWRRRRLFLRFPSSWKIHSFIKGWHSIGICSGMEMRGNESRAS